MRDRLRALIEPDVTAAGLELWDIELDREADQTVLRVLVEHPRGVTIEQCRAVSLRVAETLDHADPLPDAFTLEVASPGVERTLRHRGDLERYTGRLARITTTGPINGTRRHEGRLAGLSGDAVTIVVRPGVSRHIPITAIRSANLVYDPALDRQPVEPVDELGKGTERYG